MNKGKIVALLGLSVLSIGVLAGGAIALSENSFSSLQAAELINGKCGLTFDRLARPTLANGEGYAQDGHVRLKYEKAEDITARKGNVVLNKGGVIYTDATPYDASKGWGSVTNGIKKISVSLVNGKVQLYTAYTLKQDGTPNWQKVFENPQTSNFDYLISESYPPRYFKVEAIEKTTIDSIKVTCTALDEIEEKTRIADGTYVGNYHYEITPVDENKFDYPGKSLIVKGGEITFAKPKNSQGDLEDLTLYLAGYLSSNSDNIYVTDKDAIHPEVFYLHAEQGNTYSLKSKPGELYKIDKNNPASDLNTYLVSMSGITNNVKECTSITITKNGRPFNPPKGVNIKTEQVFTLEANIGENVIAPVIWSVDQDNALKITSHNDGRNVEITPIAKEGSYIVSATCNTHSASIKFNVSYAFPSELINTNWEFVDSKDNTKSLVATFDSKGNVTFNQDINGKVTELGRINITRDTTKVADELNYVSKDTTGILNIKFSYKDGTLKILDYLEEANLNLFKGLVNVVGQPYEFKTSITFPSKLANRTFIVYYDSEYDFEYEDYFYSVVHISFNSDLASINLVEKYSYTLNDVKLNELEDHGTYCAMKFVVNKIDSNYSWLTELTINYNYAEDMIELVSYGQNYPTIDSSLPSVSEK